MPPKKIVVVEELRTAPLGLRIRPSLKGALEALAANARRPLANYIEMLLEDHVEQKRTEGKRR
jgi:hypothetical protein